MSLSRTGRRRPALLFVAAAAALLAMVGATLSTAASASPAPASHVTPVTTSVTKVNPQVSSAKAHRDRRLLAGTRAERAVHAKHALQRAERALSPSTPAAERPDATLSLRKLWLLRGSLSRADRQAANKLEARPPSNAVDCSSAIACVHWIDGTVSPSWPGTVRDVINAVGTVYRASGYRATLPDGTLGGSPATDIYIKDLPPGLYGYCTTDQKKLSKPGVYTVWAYCVLDDDYSEFPAHTPLENLEVTAAHEFFHATQFAYDYFDDPWFLESTAAWMEDEVYPTVNDNLQYLAVSPITQPRESMDTFENGGVFHYGVWNFFRYLTEKFPAKKGYLPKLILDAWKDADSSRGPRHDMYSVQAINKALRKVGHSTLAKEFALYSDATRRTHTSFAEGAALNYPTKKLAGQKKLKKKGRSAAFTAKLNHLTSSTYRFNSAGLSGKSKLKLFFDLAPRSAGSEAVISTYKTNGSVKTTLVRLNSGGNAVKKVAFGSDKVQAIEVTLVNASIRFKNCYKQSTPWSCSGIPVDQHLVEKVRGVVT